MQDDQDNNSDKFGWSVVMTQCGIVDCVNWPIMLAEKLFNGCFLSNEYSKIKKNKSIMNYREKRTDLRISKNCSPKIKIQILTKKMCVL